MTMRAVTDVYSPGTVQAKAFGMLAGLAFEQARDLIEAHPTDFAEEKWQRTLTAIKTFLAQEEPEGPQMRALSGMFGISPSLIANAYLLGDSAPSHVKALRPIVQILYDDYVEAGGKPFTDEDRAEALAKYRESLRRDSQTGEAIH